MEHQQPTSLNQVKIYKDLQQEEAIMKNILFIQLNLKAYC